MADTLFEFFNQQGQKLPSLQQRGKLFEQFGLGSATEFSGNADQNTQLLRTLEAQQGVPQGQPQQTQQQQPQAFGVPLQQGQQTPTAQQTPLQQLQPVQQAQQPQQVQPLQQQPAQQQPVDTSLFLRPGETPEQYFARVSQQQGFNQQQPQQQEPDTPQVQEEQDEETILESHLRDLGVSVDRFTALQSPERSFEDIFEGLFERLGLNDVKEEIAAQTEEIEKVDAEIAEKVVEINDNPWLTEAVRQKQIRKVEDTLRGKKEALVNRLQLNESLLNRGREDARFVATQALNVFFKERDFQQDQLEFLSERAERAFELNQKDEKLNRQVIDAGGRRKLVDLNTGEVIADFGVSKISSANEKEPTRSQFEAAGYATRIEQSNNIINDLEEDFLNLDPVVVALQRRLPNQIKNNTVRQMEQAERNFINAVLRRESGAAIAESEFSSARKQYLPQPGDDPQTIAQKTANRQLVFESLAREAGNAYQKTSLTEIPGRSQGGEPTNQQLVPEIERSILEEITGQSISKGNESAVLERLIDEPSFFGLTFEDLQELGITR